jgi:SP family general alpha glucoside:H+ symporter-like MFS transporter
MVWSDQSIFAETFASRWDHWLVAKLLSGMGVGMLQCTVPLYLSEIAPTQLKGFFINAYSLYVPTSLQGKINACHLGHSIQD